MKKTIVKTDNYLLVVDNSVINLDDWVYTDTQVLFQYGIEHKRNPSTKKVIAHLPFGMYSTLEGVPLLPPLEVDDDVQNLAKDYLFNDYQNHFNVKTNDEQFGVLKGYMNGFNKAREKYKFTEEDVLRIIDMSKEEKNINPSCDDNMWVAKYSKDELIQSLSQPKTPTHFEFEMEDELAIDGHTIIGRNPKTTTNSQGQEVACGQYIYAS